MANATLEEKKALLSRVGPISWYKPLPTLANFHKSQAKFRWMFGGNRSGKSEGHIGYDISALALNRHPYSSLPPNATIWACAPTWEMVGKILWKEKMERYIPPHNIAEMVWHNKQAMIPKEIRLCNGNTIEYKAFEQGRKIFQGRGVHYIGWDEQGPQDIFIECQARLMDFNGRFGLSATPIQPQPWLEEIIDDPASTDEIFYADLNDNRKSRDGYIDDEEIDLMISRWPEEVQETRIKGHFAGFFGAVYKGFDRSVHVVEPFTIPEEWVKYRGIDFGYNNPFVCLWLARSPDNEWVAYAEHYQNQQLLKYHADKIHAYSNGDSFISTVADHDAQGRRELANLGIQTIPARKAVNEGIESVQRAIKIQGNGKPRLTIFNTCRNLARELGGYRYPEGLGKKDPKDEPIKLNDHTVDALRYIIHTAETAKAGVYVGA